MSRLSFYRLAIRLRTQKIRWSCALLALAGIAACSFGRDQFLAEARQVLDATRVAGASGASLVELPRRNNTRTAVWQLSIFEPWRAYCERLRRELRFYHEISDAGADAVFVRRTPGDSFSLRVEQIVAGGSLRAHFTFTALPD